MTNFLKETMTKSCTIAGDMFTPTAGGAAIFQRGISDTGERFTINGPACLKSLIENDRITVAKLKNANIFVVEFQPDSFASQAVTIVDTDNDTFKYFEKDGNLCYHPVDQRDVLYYLAIIAAKIGTKLPDLKEMSYMECEDAFSAVSAEVQNGIYEDDLPGTDEEAEALYVETKTALINSGYELILDSGFAGVIAEAVPRVKAKATSRFSALWEDVLNGKFFIKGYDFKADEEMFPSLEWLKKNYTPTPEFFSALQSLYTRYTSILDRISKGEKDYYAIVSDDQTNLSFYGAAGSGKTFSVKALAAALHMPYYLMSCSKHTDEEHYEGIHRPDENGKWDFCDTVFTKWYRDGGLMCLDEWNKQAAGVADRLSSVIEDPWVLMIDGHILTHRNPIAPMITTENIGMAGCQEQSPAMLTRFPECYSFDVMDKTVFIDAMVKRGYERAKAEYVHDALTKVIDFILTDESANSDAAMLMSTRSCKAALKKMKEGFCAKDALKLTIVNLIAKVDEELADMVAKSVIDALPDVAV